MNPSSKCCCWSIKEKHGDIFNSLINNYALKFGYLREEKDSNRTRIYLVNQNQCESRRMKQKRNKPRWQISKILFRYFVVDLSNWMTSKRFTHLNCLGISTHWSCQQYTDKMCLVLVILVVLLHIYLQSGIKEKKDTRRKKKKEKKREQGPKHAVLCMQLHRQSITKNILLLKKKKKREKDYALYNCIWPSFSFSLILLFLSSHISAAYRWAQKHTRVLTTAEQEHEEKEKTLKQYEQKETYPSWRSLWINNNDEKSDRTVVHMSIFTNTIDIIRFRTYDYNYKPLPFYLSPNHFS